MTEYDSPWKEVLDAYLERFMQLCFPSMHARIDWSRGYVPLDKELQQIAPAAETGKRYVDKLFQVYLVTGEEEWILIHIEVQTQPDADFPQRMFVYHYRLLDRYNKRVASLAVLGDDDPNWLPERYVSELFGCRLEFQFPTVKLLDFAGQVATLVQGTSSSHDRIPSHLADNPFAVVVAAHLAALRTQHNSGARYDSKWSLVRGLYERGLDAGAVRQLFRFIDWLLDLPDALTARFSIALHELEQEKQMPYVTSIERLAEQRGFALGVEKGIEQGVEKGIEQGVEKGIEQGIEQGIKQGIEAILRLRFGAAGVSLMDEIRELSNLPLLRRILIGSEMVARPEDLRAMWHAESAPEAPQM